jgi:four helix bundle protein
MTPQVVHYGSCPSLRPSQLEGDYQLALGVYRITKEYPKEEIFGLVSQMRRSAVSIPCNITEGYRRKHRRENIRFLHIAQGSCGEHGTLIPLSKDLDLVDEFTLETLYRQQDEVSRLLNGLIRSLPILK